MKKASNNSKKDIEIEKEHKKRLEKKFKKNRAY